MASLYEHIQRRASLRTKEPRPDEPRGTRPNADPSIAAVSVASVGRTERGKSLTLVAPGGLATSV